MRSLVRGLHSQHPKSPLRNLTGAIALLVAQATASAHSADTPSAPFIPPVSAIPTPQDMAWPGTLTLAVDASDVEHRLLHVTQVVPVRSAGRMTLLYPRWLPGQHGPYGDVSELAGLQIRAGSQRLEWERDTLDPHAFHVDVPPGVSQLTLQFQHLAPLNGRQGRISVTRQILGVQWNQVLLYPAGHFASAIRVQARVKLPMGWQTASALRNTDGSRPEAGADGWIQFGPTSLDTLVDSPLFAGQHLKRIELDDPGTARPVTLNLVADQADQLDATPAQINAHRALVRQADHLFGVRHWRHYDFLLALSDQFGGIGLEHQESSENGVRPSYFKDWDKAVNSRELLPHEFVHAWNGKYRRPLDLWTPQFNVPMRNSLLWMYEGMTQYWGHVLATRAGLTTPEQARHTLAQVAASLDARSGRVWRNLQDTTNEGTLASRRDKPWRDWQRGVDYYDEATLIWLDADTLIREKSGGALSLDDMARAFFSASNPTDADGAPRALTYQFDDIVKALNAVQAHDWASFLRQRLDTHEPRAPLDGLTRSGWRLAWSETESPLSRDAEGWGGASGKERSADFQYSLGLRIATDGKVDQVMWNSPAFQAGLAPGMSVVAVTMSAYKANKLAAAITANKSATSGKVGPAPIQLLVQDGDQFRQLTIDWRGGLRYPVLERIGGNPDRMSDIHKAR